MNVAASELVERNAAAQKSRYDQCSAAPAGVLELFTAPKSPYTRALLAALPENATGDRLPTISGFSLEEAN